MAETKLRDRAFALSLAVLFAFTALATSVAVIISIVSSNKHKSTSSGSNTSTSQKCTTTCLAGKPLAGFTPVASVPVLKITDTKAGTGTVATANSTVSVIYTGALATTGIVFQSSSDNGPQPVTFALSGTIPGFKHYTDSCTL